MKSTRTPKTASRVSIEAARAKAAEVASWLEDKKAMDVTALDVGTVCPITEAIVVATATSPRHARGLADYILDLTGERKYEFLGMEGHADGNWILVDLNDVLVHIFIPEYRGLYNLEGLWSEATVIPRAASDAEGQ